MPIDLPSDLPPLPEPYQKAVDGYYDSNWARVPATPDKFIADQMAVYARQARAAARAEVEPLVRQMLAALSTCDWIEGADENAEAYFCEDDVDEARKAARAWLSPQVGDKGADTLGWCGGCGEGVTNFCRGNLATCPKGLPRATAQVGDKGDGNAHPL